MNTIQDNVTFGAKLIYHNMPGCPNAWSRVAQRFEMLTKKYPNDSFKIEANDKGGIYFNPIYTEKRLVSLNSYDKGEISPKASKIIRGESGMTLTKVLVNIFTIRRKADAMLADYFKLEHKHCDEIYCNKIYPGNDIALVKFVDRAMKVRKDMTKIMLKRDNFLKDLNGISIV